MIGYNTTYAIGNSQKHTVLSSLTIIKYTLADQLEVDFSRGMSAITGETGAGKSLIIDALGMALGDRGDTGREWRRYGSGLRPPSRRQRVAGRSRRRHRIRHDDLRLVRASPLSRASRLTTDASGTLRTLGRADRSDPRRLLHPRQQAQ